MSQPPPLNTRLAQAINATRVGFAIPVQMGEGPLGRLFERRMQALIADRLPAAAHDHYAALRDQVRAAVSAARRRDHAAAEAGFAAAERIQDTPPATEANIRAELRALGRSWIDQGYAYFLMRQAALGAAGERLQSAMAADRELEEQHGYELFHIGRVHTVHLWLRLQAQGGDGDGALDCAQAILAYVNGAADTLPVDSGWSADRAAAVPAELRAAMTFRIASEVGTLLAPLPPEAAMAGLSRVPALTWVTPSPEVDDGAAARPPEAATSNAGSQGEIADWHRIKTLWCHGDSDAFLQAATPFLTAGRRQTTLWYAVLLDLCRCTQALRPHATHPFVVEVAGRVAEETLPNEVLPGLLKHNLTALPREGATPGAGVPIPSYQHRRPRRRFHVMSVGLPRTGTSSLYTLFANYRAGNEFMEAESIRTLVARSRGDISDEDLDDFLYRRDREGGLEMDAASFLHLALDRLPWLFPDARFVLTVRHPRDWFDSYLRMLLRWHDQYASRNKAMPAWMTDYGRMLFGDFDWAEIATPDARAETLPDLAGRFFRHWAEATSRALNQLPSDRTLILRTEKLSQAVERLAAFAGVPAETLTDRHHSNASPPGASPIAALAPQTLTTLEERLCGGVLSDLRQWREAG